jgi:hypothetical protein
VRKLFLLKKKRDELVNYLRYFSTHCRRWIVIVIYTREKEDIIKAAENIKLELIARMTEYNRLLMT